MDELKTLQNYPLALKIALTKNRLREWVDQYGLDGVYVSFSGGKDSTVLLDIARSMYPEMKAVFFDTGLEFPEIRQFVKSFDNVDWLKPKMTFKQVVEKYGYPFISKEVGDGIQGARRYVNQIAREKDCDDTTAIKFSDLEDIVRERGTVQSQMMMGVYPSKVAGKKSSYNKEKWKFLVDAPFSVSSHCCNVLKKSPAHSYGKQTGRKPITAQMATESRRRATKWLQNGCNGFDMKSPISNPLSFWTEQDVLSYIYLYKLPICSVYGNIVTDDEIPDGVDLSQIAANDSSRPTFKTTGCKRTGCMFCGFGCHVEKEGEGRFEMMKNTHPVQYDYIMRPTSEGGLGYKEIIDYINEHGKTHIRY